MNTDEAKRRLGEWACDRVQPGTRLGIGSGTTVQAFITALGKRRIPVQCACASLASERLARAHGLSVKALAELPELDLAVDGADAVGEDGTLIKGGGAALVRERLLIDAALHTVILIDNQKPRGSFRDVVVPVAVIPYGWRRACERISRRAPATLRMRGAEPVVTDDGLYIVDAVFRQIDDAARVYADLKNLAGVVDVGLFLGYQPEVWVGDEQAVWRWV